MDGKKKKNKKKKGNSQSKLTDDVPANVEQVVVPNHDNGSSPQLNHLSQVSSTIEFQSGGVSQSDIEPDKHKIKLQEEIRQLDDERNLWLQKEVSLEEKIQLLQSDVDSCLKKEASFEEKLKSLQSGNDLLIQKQAIFEDRVNYIEDIKDSLILKETMINEMASRWDDVNLKLQEQTMINEMASRWDDVNLKLQEQTMINEMASRWDDVNLKLQEQVKEVKELKESRDELVQENAKLREGIAVIESRLQYIETETSLSKTSDVMIPKQSSAEETPQSEPETASSLPSDVQEHAKTEVVEKQSSVEEIPQPEPETTSLLSDVQEHEKTEVVEKLKEVQIEPDQRANDANPSTTPEIDREKKSTESSVSIDGHAPRYGKEMYESVEMIPSNGAENFGTGNGRMDVARIISEDVVVSVPLDDIQVHEARPQSEEEEEETPLPISDAPLIGAPFRLISFFAKYVSGADLVQRDGD